MGTAVSYSAVTGSGGIFSPTDPPHQPSQISTTDTIKRRHSIRSWIRGNPEPHKGNNRSAFSDKQHQAAAKPSSMSYQCCACLEQINSSPIITLECKHSYCPDCLRTMIMQSVQNVERFPPRCCKIPFPENQIPKVLSAEESKIYADAVKEFGTKDKTYCSNGSCGEFIFPDTIKAGVATCSRCLSSTCAMCKKPFHTDDCPSDPGLQATLELAQKKGWKRCCSCKALVERISGCSHVR